jgi:hypothetical protein
MSKTISFPNDKATNEWLDTQKAGTKKVYACHFRKFLEFTGLTGDQILADRKKDVAEETFRWEAKTLEFKVWLANKKFSPYAATCGATAARAFFGYHRKPLKFRTQERRKLIERTRLHEDYKFSIEDFAKGFAVSDLEEKYVLTAGKSFGLRAGDFLRLTRGDLEPYLDREVPISIGEYNTQKEGVKAFPLIDSDAQPIIKLMLQKLDKEGRTGPNEKMLKFKFEIQLSRVLRRITENAGINVGNKQVRFHCLRKFLIDHLSSYMSESKWKQICGKTISEGAYVSADSLRADYKRAMAETTFAKAAEIEDRVKDLETFKKSLSPEQLETARRLGMVRQRAKKDSTKTDCADGSGNCQKIVNEENLGEFLSQGFRVVATLPSGKIVIDDR